MPTTEFFKYKVKEGDTFISIGKRLKVDPFDLRTFHNQYASASEVVFFDTLNVPYIYIQTDYRKQNKSLKNDLELRPSKEFSPKFYSNTYQVTELFEDLYKENVEINYQLKLGFSEENNQIIVHLYRLDFIVNGEKSATNLSELTQACSAILEPLSFIISKNGEILAIHESENRLEQFKAKRSALEAYYVGENTKLFLDIIENNLSNDDYFLKQYTSTPLFQLLFPKRSWFYKTTAWEEYFYFAFNSFPIQCKTEAVFSTEDKHILETEIKAVAVEKYSVEDVMRGIKTENLTDDFFKGELVLKYFTDKANKDLLEAKLTRIIEYQTQIKERYSLTLKQT